MAAAVSLLPFADITPRASCVAFPPAGNIDLVTQSRTPVLTLSQPTEHIGVFPVHEGGR